MLRGHIPLITTNPVEGDNIVARGYPQFLPDPAASQAAEPQSTPLGRVYINKTQYFDRVPQATWEFHVGGYQVLEKWLKDRRERTLSYEDSQHYQKIVTALTETITLMDQIDEAIPSWPLQ